MKNKKLLPCPFCGSEKIIVGLKPTGYFAICDKCSARTGQYLDKESVIKRWNTRTNTIPVGNGKDYTVVNE